MFELMQIAHSEGLEEEDIEKEDGGDMGFSDQRLVKDEVCTLLVWFGANVWWVDSYAKENYFNNRNGEE